MNDAHTPTRAELIDRLTEGLRGLYAERDDSPPPDLGEQTRLLGPEAVVASLALVSLIVELEQALEDEYGVTVTIADDRAMSQRQSPFRTVGTLADYVAELVRERGAAG